METHPVPQNVTSFEFHLIGDMTIKQFCYLALGLTIAYVTYLTLAQTVLWIALPIIIISAGTGAAFAFVPIQDRPLDHWARAFFTAVYSPTQRKWKAPTSKNQTPVDGVLLLQKRLQLYMNTDKNTLPVAAPITAPVATPQPAIKRVQRPVFNENIFQPNAPTPATPAPSHAPVVTSSNDKLEKTVELAKEAQAIQTQILNTEKQMDQLKSAATKPGTQPGAYAEDIQEVFANLQNLIKNAQLISNQLGDLTPPAHKTGPSAATPPPVTPAAPKTRRILPTLTSQPNVINGIVTDAAGNYLENVVVVIHNQDGLPVRALKTNKLGQFTGATPLPDGPYTLSLEKDNLEFQPVKTELSNKVMPPMEIAAQRGEVVNA